MPRSKTGNKRAPVDPDALKNALDAIRTDDPTKKMSYREASKVFNVSRSTLTRHLNKFKDSTEKEFIYSVNYAVKQVFTVAEEDCLVKYIQNVAKMQYGLTKKGVRQLAYKYAKANGGKIPETWSEEQIAGEEWMRGFLKRHSQQLSVRKPEATSLSRATSFNRYNVECFFNNLKDVHSRFGPIPPEKIWNLDETGLSTVQGQSKVVAPKGMKQIGSATSAERGQLVTLITCVNAVGNALPPMLIFPRVNFKERMLFGGPPGCIGAASVSGWSNKDSFLKFLDHILASVKCSKEDRALLVLDNHETHLSPEALEKASAAGLVMVTFPPHTSHRLQPLDISVYGPLKTYYNQSVESWLFNNKGKTFDIYTVAEALGISYPRAFTPQNILSGFRKSGIYPLDQGIFTDDDFLSAYVTDQIAQKGKRLSEEFPVSSENEKDKFCGQSTSASTNLNEPIPGTSKENRNYTIGSDTPITKKVVKKIVTPEEVQPYPKAAPRKDSNRGRKARKTIIATDTPEKQAIKDMKEKKHGKNINREVKLQINLRK